MIVSFGDRRTEDLYNGVQSARAQRVPADVRGTALRKLDMLEGAENLEDLRVPPSNRLEALRGRLAGRFSIRVNDQWRLVFRWEPDGAHGVTFTDYH